MKLFDTTAIPSLSKALGAYSLRHKAIASNIANVETPGYNPKRVRFEEELSSADGLTSSLRGMVTNDRHLPIGQMNTLDVVPSLEDVKPDALSGVDIDQEMADLAKNQIRYKFSARIVSEAFRALQSSIKGTI